MDAITNKDKIFAEIGEKMRTVEAEVKQTVLGVDRVIHLLTIALFARGHVLLEGVPGTAKTTLLRCLAATVGGGFERIQGTPDLLPGDLVSIPEMNPETGKFMVSPGPLIRQGENLAILFVDEINRIQEKTQAYSLEPMEERAVTVAGKKYKLPYLIVFASRNPIERDTFELPHAQRDRFWMEIEIRYPDAVSEKDVIVNPRFEDIDSLVGSIKKAVSMQEIKNYSEWISRNIYVSDKLAEYLYKIADASRHPKKYNVSFPDPDDIEVEVDPDTIIVAGISTRGIARVRKLAQVAALFRGSRVVEPRDVHEILVEAVAHRIFLSPNAMRRRSKLASAILAKIQERVSPYGD
jgi:MoxR-like ATPase